MRAFSVERATLRSAEDVNRLARPDGGDTLGCRQVRPCPDQLNMATLSRELRKALEKVVLTARGEAEAGARKALEQLAVAHREPWATMTSDQQALRRRLRARGRQLGDRLEDGGKQGIEHLVSECAYEHWHRMLFARFLAECGLLIEPESGVPVSRRRVQGTGSRARR